MTTMAAKQSMSWRSVLKVLMNPGSIVKEWMDGKPWAISLAVSAIAYLLFFLQTGIDLMRTGNAGGTSVALFALLGAVYGSVGVAASAALAWMMTKAFGSQQSLKGVISAFGLSYSATLIYALLGLIFSLSFGWNTSVAFGVSGVLWALGPMIATIKELTGGRLGVSIGVATLCGGLMLFGWAMLGNL